MIKMTKMQKMTTMNKIHTKMLAPQLEHQLLTKIAVTRTTNNEQNKNQRK